MVEMNVVLNVSSENLNRMHVLPTPESPIRSSLKSRSYLRAILGGDGFLVVVVVTKNVQMLT